MPCNIEIVRPGDPGWIPPRQITRPPFMAGHALNLKCHYNIEHWRRNNDGILVLHNKFACPNGIVNEGKLKLLDVMFHGVAAITTWYHGLIDNAGFTALADDDTYDDINQAGNGWDEFTAYTDGNNANNATTRPQWQEDAASGNAISNTTLSIFNITASGTVKGVFLVGGGTAPQTKGDHAPGSTLWGTALFTAGDTAIVNGDQIKLTYTVQA